MKIHLHLFAKVVKKLEHKLHRKVQRRNEQHFKDTLKTDECMLKEATVGGKFIAWLYSTFPPTESNKKLTRFILQISQSPITHSRVLKREKTRGKTEKKIINIFVYLNVLFVDDDNTIIECENAVKSSNI